MSTGGNFTVTFQRSKSHASDHSSLSDEEDSSDTGIQVSTPSGGDSQGSSHEEDSDSQDEYEEDWTAIQQEDANSSDSASQTNISNKQPRIPRAPAPQVQRESKTPHQDQSRSRTVRTRRIRKPAVSLSTESVEDSYEDGWGGESLHRTRQPYSHWATSSSVPASAQYPLGYNTYQAQGVPGGQLALRMSNANSPYAYSPYQQQNVPTYYQHNAHMGSLHQPTSYAQPAGYFPYPAQYQVGPMPQYYPPPVIYSPPPPAPAPSQTPPAAPAPAPAPAPTTAPAQVVPVTSPAPAAATPDPNNEKFDQLRQLILDQKAEQEAKEAAAKKAEEDRKAAEAAAKKIADDLAAAKKEAAAKATTEAEKKAAEAAAKKEAEAAAKAKKEAESKAKTEADAAAAAAAAAAAKPPPPPPEKKKPIKFKDAVGRKFSFPFHLCNTWEGMEDLIKQAFLHVDVIGPHVADGHYDLVGPDGEIILPQVWKTVIEPDWTITMHLWPIPEPPPEPAPADPVVDVPVAAAPAPEVKHGKGIKKKKQAAAPPPAPPVPPPPPAAPAAPAPPKEKKPKPKTSFWLSGTKPKPKASAKVVAPKK